ncbi:MAG: ABC transporter substrate-binding protein, partial [Chloroflexota bacterium]
MNKKTFLSVGLIVVLAFAAMLPGVGAQDAIEIEFWHAMGGGLGESVDELVALFNESQDEIVVNATFQGSYDDTYNALLAAFETSTEPNLIQNFDLAA